ncbi:MAG: ribonuclease catalytic domain-containing protein [Thermodesulfobacteriota bacterium]
MTQGKTVEYIDQGKFICTLCLEDKSGRLHLLTTQNRQVNVSAKRVLLISSRPLDDPSRPREDLLAGLRRAEERRNALAREVRVRELWELIHDENESFDYRYLAELCFGEGVDDDHISAVVRALFEDKLHFKLKDGRFLPNTPERIDEIVRRRDEEVRLERLLSEGSEWLRRRLEGEAAGEPECVDEVVRLLCSLALYGNDFPEYKHARELLSRGGYSDPRVARKLLIKLGVWEEDEDLDLLRLQIRTDFGDEQIAASEALKNALIDTTAREDLRNLETLTIDGPATRDFDDALSLEVSDGEFEVGVHIADVAGSVPMDSPIDREAYQRGVSLYLPRRQVHMIPPSLSQDTLSLVEGFDRPAISLLCRMNHKGEVLGFRFTPSLIRVKRRLTYDHVNNQYREDPLLRRMHGLATAFQQTRIEKGALVLSTPEPIISVDNKGGVSIDLVEQDTPARMLVAEFMILHNWLAARFCRDRRIPILYRAQDEPSDRLKKEEMDPLFFVFMQRRKLQPMTIDTDPGAHAGLGLEVYTNVTSPIRRYLDLVIQRQIRSTLLGGPPLYDAETLDKIRINVESTLKDLASVRRNRTRYWTQKYLRRNLSRPLEALVLWSTRNRHRILLTEVMLVTDLKRKNGRDLEPGSRIRVAVEKSDPWEDVLTLGLVEEPA